MKPLIKLHSTILSITTLLIFVLWINLTDQIIKYPYLSVLFSGIISIGVYRVLLTIIGNIIKKNWWIKKLFFGGYYLQGIWIGYFEGNNGTIRFFIETFEQDFDELIIRGEAYKAEGGFHGSWIAEATNINVSKGTLSYTYHTDAIKNSFINPGIAVFNLKRKTQYKPPFQLVGFSSDLYSSNKLKAIEIKISDKTTYNTEETLDKAKKFYESQKNYF
ncbi:MAG: hypothetical protein HQ543_02955 [Bacteroidetes bacterium]|nr:hypothetical protein [Bacteroidota bacterium]